MPVNFTYLFTIKDCASVLCIQQMPYVLLDFLISQLQWIFCTCRFDSFFCLNDTWYLCKLFNRDDYFVSYCSFNECQIFMGIIRIFVCKVDNSLWSHIRLVVLFIKIGLYWLLALTIILNLQIRYIHTLAIGKKYGAYSRLAECGCAGLLTASGDSHDINALTLIVQFSSIAVYVCLCSRSELSCFRLLLFPFTGLDGCFQVLFINLCHCEHFSALIVIIVNVVLIHIPSCIT